jgi:hypothetical protein
MQRLLNGRDFDRLNSLSFALANHPCPLSSLLRAQISLQNHPHLKKNSFLCVFVFEIASVFFTCAQFCVLVFGAGLVGF